MAEKKNMFENATNIVKMNFLTGDDKMFNDAIVNIDKLDAKEKKDAKVAQAMVGKAKEVSGK